MNCGGGWRLDSKPVELLTCSVNAAMTRKGASSMPKLNGTYVVEQLKLRRMASSGMLRRVALVRTDVWEERVVTIISVN
jgi:hypothetical protein